MKYVSIRWSALCLALTAVSAVFFAAGATRADEIPTAIKGYNYTAAIRGGIYYNLHNDLQNLLGTPAPIGGLAVTLEQEPLQNRSSVAVDYLEKSKNGSKERIIPVAFEYQWYQAPQGVVNPYFILGVGGAWVYLNDLVSGTSDTKLAFDTSLGLGVDTPWQVFAELRYNWIAPTLGEDFSGPSLLFGVRF
ncbi:MAG: hypothetical protein P4L33_19325 [Capsulimonadaceae bacterium]|nr:hypothetical protein [Capsulimonadaceae bacterium]